MAFGAVDVEAFVSAIEKLFIDGEGEAVAVGIVDLSRFEERVRHQLAAGDSAGNARTGRHPISKEIARLERIVARLPSHLLPTGTDALA